MPRPTPAIQPSTRQYIESDAIAQGYDEYFEGSDLFEYDSRLLASWMPRPGRLIDLGCGSGRHVLPFARAGFDVIGADLSRAMLAVAGEKLSRAGLRARLIEADVVDIDSRLPAGWADYIICMFSTLGLIAGRANRLRAVRAWHGLLRPGGLLAVHAHNRWHNLYRTEGLAFLVGNAVRTLAGRSEWGDKYIPSYRGIQNMYIHVFTRAELRALLTAGGFEIVEWVSLNERRNGPARPAFGCGLWANGFIVLARAASRPAP
ncbi:MAG: methyltransferase domain-containing protein [Phycisphaerae bacterium]|nr:methyltransferase domain-containing protein [Phycisphaerae bacterium]